MDLGKAIRELEVEPVAWPLSLPLAPAEPEPVTVPEAVPAFHSGLAQYIRQRAAAAPNGSAP